MPQKTEVEPPKNAPDQSVAPPEQSAAAATTAAPETHSASEPPPSRAGRFMQSNPRAHLYLIAAILVVLVVGFFAWRYFESYESTDDAEVDGHLMPLSARVSGYVTKVNVDDNQYVTAGTVLVEIDPRYFRPTEVDLLIGNPAKAHRVLGWQHETSFEALVSEMVREDLAIVTREQAYRAV